MITRKENAVMILEDSDEDFDTALEAMARTNLRSRVYRAVTGDQCVQLLRGALGATAVRPAFVLLDLNTPGMDGRGALSEIRSEAAFSVLPIVVLSTSNNPRDITECYEHGANAYHVKPVRYGEHLQLVSDLMTYWLCSAVTPFLERTP